MQRRFQVSASLPLLISFVLKLLSIQTLDNDEQIVILQHIAQAERQNYDIKKWKRNYSLQVKQLF